jgi:hypothetical protein
MRSGAAVVAVGAVMVVALLPLVLGTLAHPWVALLVAGLLLAIAFLVRPEGPAAPLRWIPAGFGLLALAGAVVGLFS